MTPETLSLKKHLFSGPETHISGILSEKQRTVLAVISLNMGITMRKSSLKFQNINTKEHSRLHHVNSYDSFFGLLVKNQLYTGEKIGRRTE